ncbi:MULTISPECIES: hypothetical protein [Streptomycetaceae]|uniref:hypothetical protein n=1 Tax=Streptomycetaceae TaxID=2062 RepID=UPI00300A0152
MPTKKNSRAQAQRKGRRAYIELSIGHVRFTAPKPTGRLAARIRRATAQCLGTWYVCLTAFHLIPRR